MDYDRFEQWMLNRMHYSPRTARLYRNRVRQAIEDLGFDPRRHTPEQVEQWVHEQGGSSSNHDSWVCAFRRLQDFYADQYNQELHFADRLKIAPRPKRLPRPIAMQDVERIIESTPLDTLMNMRDRAILEVLYCGLRNEEVCNAQLRHFRDREVRIVGKGNKERIVPLNDSAWSAVLRYALHQHGDGVTIPDDLGELEDTFTVLRMRLAQEDPERTMFLSTEGNPLTPRRVREIVARAVRRAGLNMKVTPHMFRHSFATHTLDCGATDLFALMQVLGHTNLEMTKRYVEVSKAGRGRINAFHPRQRRGVLQTSG